MADLMYEQRVGHRITHEGVRKIRPQTQSILQVPWFPGSCEENKSASEAPALERDQKIVPASEGNVPELLWPVFKGTEEEQEEEKK